MSTNTITLAGSLATDPEIRYTRDGIANVFFGVSVVDDGEVRVFDVTALRELAENVALSLTKNSRVIIVGKLLRKDWTTDEGEARSKTLVLADNIAASMTSATVEVTSTQRRSYSEPVARPSAEAVLDEIASALSVDEWDGSTIETVAAIARSMGWSLEESPKTD